MAIPTRQQLEQVLKLKPNSVVFAHLAYSCLQEGDVDRAFSLCESHMVNHKKYAFGHFVFGVACFEKGDLEMARAELEASVYMDPANIMAWKTLANVYSQLNDDDKYLIAASMGLLDVDGENKQSIGEADQIDEFESDDFLENLDDTISSDVDEYESTMTEMEEQAEEVSDMGALDLDSELLDENMDDSGEELAETEITSLDDLPSIEDLDAEIEAELEDNEPEMDLDEESDVSVHEDDEATILAEKDEVTDELDDLSDLAELDDLGDELGVDELESILEDGLDEESTELDNEDPGDISGLENDQIDAGANDEILSSENVLSGEDDSVADTADLTDQPYETVQLDAMFDVDETATEEADLAEIKSDVDATPKTLTSTLGEIYISQGKFQEALQVFEKLLEGSPDNRRFQRKVKELKELIEMNNL